MFFRLCVIDADARCWTVNSNLAHAVDKDLKKTKNGEHLVSEISVTRFENYWRCVCT